MLSHFEILKVKLVSFFVTRAILFRLCGMTTENGQYAVKQRFLSVIHLPRIDHQLFRLLGQYIHLFSPRNGERNSVRKKLSSLFQVTNDRIHNKEGLREPRSRFCALYKTSICLSIALIFMSRERMIIASRAIKMIH